MNQRKLFPDFLRWACRASVLRTSFAIVAVFILNFRESVASYADTISPNGLPVTLQKPHVSLRKPGIYIRPRLKGFPLIALYVQSPESGVPPPPKSTGRQGGR
jgi:hypothetical protein